MKTRTAANKRRSRFVGGGETIVPEFHLHRVTLCFRSDPDLFYRKNIALSLLQYPEAGKVVPGSGGVRKVRWAIAGKGKSGGVRVIYYFKRQENEIWLLTIYSKSEVENIPAHILRQIAKEIENV